MTDLHRQFGQIDIYLFDQLLRGRIRPGMRVFDAGCGYGRNLVYLLREGFEVFGTDTDSLAIEAVRSLAASLAPALPADNFRVEHIEAMSFPDALADLVISSAVLHFARDDDQFASMLRGTWQVLKPGGLLFCRLASSIGIENQVKRIAGRRFLLPDGSERYLVDEAMLVTFTEELDAQLADPLKTTVVQNQRSMTTWVVRKHSQSSARATTRSESSLAEEVDQIHHPHRVTPLVVVPGNDVDQIAIQHLGQARVDDRTVRVVQHVGGHHRIFGVG
jgi:tellurite methyltransferase